MGEHDKITVLIVDDNEDYLQLWQFLLREDPRVGLVREAKSAEAAIQQLSLHDDIDIVLADVWMPGRSGTDIADFVGRAKPAVPVILTSCAEGVQDQALRHGATAYVPKVRMVAGDLSEFLCAVVADAHSGSAAA